MEFKKYPSLKNSYLTKELDYHRFNPLGYWSDRDWGLFEKIDGANFQLCYDLATDIVTPSSRNQFVDGTFKGCQVILDQYSELLKQFSERILGAEDHVIIYGELFGRKVMNRVHYSEDVKFLGFEIVVDGVFLSPETVEKYARFTDIPFNPLVKKGNFSDLVLESPDFRSLIPGILGEKEPEGDNFAEGWVLRPLKENYLSNGKPFIIKIKGEKFKEKDGSKKVSSEQGTVVHPLLKELVPYVTSSRLSSVASKESEEVSLETMGKFLGLMQKDILEEATSAGVIPEDFRSVEGYRSLRKQLGREIAALIKECLTHGF